MTMMILGLYNDLSSGWVFVFFDILVFITAQEWRQLLRINLQSPYIQHILSLSSAIKTSLYGQNKYLKSENIKLLLC